MKTIDEKQEIVRGWLDQGRLTVPPSQAAMVLDVPAYSLNVTARTPGRWDFKTQGFFTGRNLNINVRWLAEVVGL